MSELLGSSDVATLLGVSRPAVSNWKRRGLLVPDAMVGGRPAYKRETVEAMRRGKHGGPRERNGRQVNESPPVRYAKPIAPEEDGAWMPQCRTAAEIYGAKPRKQTLSEIEGDWK